MTQNSSATRPPWKRFWPSVFVSVLALVVGTAILLYVAGDPQRQITISPETTVATGPLTAEGFVDYAAALHELNWGKVLLEDNAFVPLLQAIGPQLTRDPEWLARSLETCGLTELPEQGTYFVHFGTEFLRGIIGPGVTPDGRELAAVAYYRIAEDGDELYECERQPWAKADHPELAAWLDTNEASLRLIQTAVQRPKYCAPFPYVPQSWMTPVNHGHYRRIGDALRLRAMNRLHEGNAVGAWSDLETCRRLGRRVASGGDAIDWLLGEYVEACCFGAMEEFVQHGVLSAEEWRVLLREYQDSQPFPVLTDAYDRAERYSALAQVQSAVMHGPGSIKGPELDESHVRWINAYVNWNTVLIEINRFYDDVVAALRIPDRATRIAAMTALESDINGRAAALKSSSEIIPSTARATSTVLVQLQPASSAVASCIDRRQMREDVCLVALALEAWRAEFGSYPAVLSDLSPTFVEAVPVDVFDGTPLKYERVGEGYLLYSVGENGIDERGATYTGSGRGADDFAMRIRLPLSAMP